MGDVMLTSSSFQRGFATGSAIPELRFKPVGVGLAPPAAATLTPTVRHANNAAETARFDHQLSFRANWNCRAS